LAKSFIDRRQEEFQRHRGIIEKLGLPLKTDDTASGTPFAPDSPTTPRSVGNFDRGHRKEAPSREDVANARSRGNMETYDLFLSHAGEDKAAIARPLFSALTAVGVTVWFDEAVLKIGDSLRRKIEEGLARCRYGIVIISPAFLANLPRSVRTCGSLLDLTVEIKSPSKT
jgi:hypothetical protein